MSRGKDWEKPWSELRKELDGGKISFIVSSGTIAELNSHLDAATEHYNDPRRDSDMRFSFMEDSERLAAESILERQGLDSRVEIRLPEGDGADKHYDIFPKDGFTLERREIPGTDGTRGEIFTTDRRKPRRRFFGRG